LEFSAVKIRKRTPIAEQISPCAHGLLKPGDAAKWLGVSRRTLYDLVNEGLLPYCQIGTRGGDGDKKIPRQSLVVFAEERLRVGTDAA
jgi:excisionase family DNA binding protein